MTRVTKEIELNLNRAVKFLSYRPRTVYEIFKYLEKKGCDKEIAGKTVEILLEKNYLNDTNFARLFVESRVNTKPKSKFALAYELKQKGVNPVIIDDILKDYNDEDLAIQSVSVKIKQWKHLDDDKFNTKVMNFLKYRGFNYDVCVTTLNHFIQARKAIRGNSDEN